MVGFLSIQMLKLSKGYLHKFLHLKELHNEVLDVYIDKHFSSEVVASSILKSSISQKKRAIIFQKKYQTLNYIP